MMLWEVPKDGGHIICGRQVDQRGSKEGLSRNKISESYLNIRWNFMLILYNFRKEIGVLYKFLNK